jgi:hypothetical protein
MDYKNIKSPMEFINESRRPIEAQKVSKTERDIKVYKTTQFFNIPVDDSNHITAKPGTTLICFENEVFLKNDGVYVKALFETKFLELNKKLFEKVDL